MVKSLYGIEYSVLRTETLNRISAQARYLPLTCDFRVLGRSVAFLRSTLTGFERESQNRNVEQALQGCKNLKL